MLVIFSESYFSILFLGGEDMNKFLVKTSIMLVPSVFAAWAFEHTGLETFRWEYFAVLISGIIMGAIGQI